MSVKELSFRKAEASDMILSSLSAKEAAESKGAEQSSGRRGRRGRLAEPQPKLGEPKAEKTQNRLVVDPELDAPFDVTFTLAVYDFGGGKAKQAEPPAGGEAAPSPVQQGKEAK